MNNAIKLSNGLVVKTAQKGIDDLILKGKIHQDVVDIIGTHQNADEMTDYIMDLLLQKDLENK